MIPSAIHSRLLLFTRRAVAGSPPPSSRACSSASAPPPDPPPGPRDGTGQSHDKAEPSPPRYATAAGRRRACHVATTRNLLKELDRPSGRARAPSPCMHRKARPFDVVKKSHGAFHSLPPPGLLHPYACNGTAASLFFLFAATALPPLLPPRLRRLHVKLHPRRVGCHVSVLV
jgi:hypothetical protein